MYFVVLGSYGSLFITLGFRKSSTINLLFHRDIKLSIEHGLHFTSEDE
jgi:hypothetical protein